MRTKNWRFWAVLPLLPVLVPLALIGPCGELVYRPVRWAFRRVAALDRWIALRLIRPLVRWVEEGDR